MTKLEIAVHISATACVVGAALIPDDYLLAMAEQLTRYPNDSVVNALERCCAELKTTRLTIRDITSRFDPVTAKQKREGEELLTAALARFGDQ